MKRLLALLLVLVWMAGCAATPPTEPPTAAPTQPPTAAPTEPPPPSLYRPDTPVEQQTAGAVRAYPLESYCDGMVLLEDQVVLYYLDERMQMKAYTGENLTLETVASHHIPFEKNGSGIQSGANGIFYFNPGTNTVVILNAQLQERSRFELPDGIQGIPVVNEDMDTVYFSTAEGIRAMDLETGIAHMLRQQENYSGILLDECFGGALLVCAVTQPDGSVVMEFVSTETGMQTGKDAALLWIETEADRFALSRMDSAEEKLLFGKQGEEDLFEFLTPEGEGKLLTALELGGLLRITELDNGSTMELYDLDSGLRKASVFLEGIGELRHVTADPRGYVWFMDADTLYRWEVDESPVADETVYTSPWYTGSDPNAEGLAQCQVRADALGRQYGLEIRIWKDAVQTPWEKLSAEFRVEVFETALTELEAVFSLFPEDMLAQMGTLCDKETVTISIVADAGTEQGQQIWLAGNAYIAVEAGETLRMDLLRNLYRVMDTYVLSRNSMLDEWDAEKPAEERTRFFVEAMTGDNGSFFESWSNQSKLRTLCRAIRRAFGMRYYEAELPWEQYLDDPLY